MAELDPHHESTWGASREYIEAWNLAHADPALEAESVIQLALDAGLDPEVVSSVSKDELIELIEEQA